MKHILLSLLTTLALTANGKVALVIGNKNYTNQTGLKNPISDAELIRDTLKGMDFEVMEVYNKKLKDLSDELDVFMGKAKSAKVAVIYYAGHGIGVGRNNYLIPIGASNLSVDNLGRKLMSLNELKGAVAKANGFGVVFFDACRNSFFAERIQGLQLSKDGASRALVQPTVKRGQNILVSFSTQAGKIAKDDVANGNHSPYALALSENLNSSKDIRLVMGSVRAKVKKLTDFEQIPVDENQLDGEEYCLGGKCEKKLYKGITKIDGLMYQNQYFVEEYTWYEAEAYCNSLTFEDYTNWRLPTRQELLKIANIKIPKFEDKVKWEKWFNQNKHKRLKNSTGNRLFIKKEFIENIPNYSSFWTSKRDKDYAWGINFEKGYKGWYKVSTRPVVLCVR